MQRDRSSPNLDFLRSVAVLVVLADHIAQSSGIAHANSAFLLLGRWGVLLFFVHTSLVLMMSMERLHVDGWSLAKAFYIRRIFRIYPLAIFVISVALVFQIPPRFHTARYETPSLVAIVSNYLLCQNVTLSDSIVGPLWSLPYEVQMYVVLPLIYMFIRPNQALGRISLLWIVAVALGLLQAKLATIPGTGAWRMGIAEFAPCFLGGVLAYQISRGERAAGLPGCAWVAIVTAVTAAFLAWQMRLATAEGFVNYAEWICCLAIGLSINACREMSVGWFNWLTHRVAKYSYGIYLGQVPILWLVFEKLAPLPPAVQWSLFVALIIGVPIATYHLIEDPLIRGGSRLASRSVAGQRDLSALPALQRKP